GVIGPGRAARARLVRMRRRGEQEVQAVLGPVVEGLPGLGGHALHPVRAGAEGVGAALALDVVGQDDVAVLGQRRGQPPVERLRRLHGARGDDHRRAARRPLARRPDVAGDRGPVAGRVEHRPPDAESLPRPAVEAQVAGALVLAVHADVAQRVALRVARQELRELHRVAGVLLLELLLELRGQRQVALALRDRGEVAGLARRVEGLRGGRDGEGEGEQGGGGEALGHAETLIEMSQPARRLRGGRAAGSTLQSVDVSDQAIELGLPDIQAAAARIAEDVRGTPVLPAPELSRRVGATVTLKAECLQVTGSFKVRGAFNAMRQIPAERLRRGVVAASAGNHGQAVALAASRLGTRADIFIPAEAPLAKVTAIRGYGGEIHAIEGAYDEAADSARAFAEAEDRELIAPFDDPRIVAGQGTVGLELAEQAPATRQVLVPLGGGGLAAGVAIAVKSQLAGAEVVGVQAEACAPYLESLRAHRPIGARSANTICDGIAVKRPGELTLPLVERWLDRVVTVGDDEVAQAMVLLLDGSKLVVEGAGAVG